MTVTILSELENVLRKSLEHASAHSKGVYGKNPLTVQELLDLANAKGPMSLGATVKPSGQPHLSPVDIVATDGKLVLGIDKATARYKNLQHNNRVTLMILDGWKRQAIIEGRAMPLDAGSYLGKQALELQKKKYGWTTDSLAELIPEKAITYKS